MAETPTGPADISTMVEMLKKLHFSAHHGDVNYAYGNSYEDDGTFLHYHSPYAPDAPGANNNQRYSRIVELSSTIPVGWQEEVMARLKVDAPDELHKLQLGCITAEYAMELYYSVVAINEIRAHARAGSLKPPLDADASIKERTDRLFEILGPTEYLGSAPERPFQYSDNYQQLASAELETLERAGRKKFGPDSQLVVAGSGPLPLTALLLHIRTGASVACLDADYISCRQQFELVRELERAGVVKPGAISVINDHPARIHYDHYIGVENGLKKTPDGLFVTYFARDMHDYAGEHASVDNETPISGGIACPRFFSPVKDVLTRAREAGIPLANVRDASGTTELLYPSVTAEDLEGVKPVSMFVPDNKAANHTPKDAEGHEAEVVKRHGLHNSGVAVVMPEISKQEGRWSNHKAKRHGWFQGLLTEEHLPDSKEAIVAFEKQHFTPSYCEVARDRQGLSWTLAQSP